MKDARSMGALVVAAAMLLAPAARAQEDPSRGAASGQLREEEGSPSAAGPTNDQSGTKALPSAANPASDQSGKEAPPSAAGATDDRSGAKALPSAANPANDQSGKEAPSSAKSPANDRPENEPPSSAMSPANGRRVVEPPSSAANGTPAPAEDHPSISTATPDSFSAYRFGYVAGGALALTGTAFGFIAQSEAIRAGTLTSARESNATLSQAREHAATANLCFVLAGATTLYALVLEFLPRPVADAASLAFRF